MSTGWIVLGVLVAIAFWVFSVYNRLVAMRQRVDQSFADIDVQLKQRHDLIPNLVPIIARHGRHASDRSQSEFARSSQLPRFRIGMASRGASCREVRGEERRTRIRT